MTLSDSATSLKTSPHEVDEDYDGEDYSYLDPSSSSEDEATTTGTKRSRGGSGGVGSSSMDLLNDRWSLKEVIGRGGLGVVRKAVDCTTNVEVREHTKHETH